MIYSREDLRTIFQSQFNSEAWIGLLVNLFGANHLLTKPDRLDSSTGDETGWYLGEFTTADHYRIGLFRFDIKNSSVSKRKIGLRNLVKPYLKYDFDCAIVAFVEGGSSRWRFSFISDLKDNETSPKRFTYVFGDSHNRYNTPVERFSKLQALRTNTEPSSKKAIEDAFSVEALSSEFYREVQNWYFRALQDSQHVEFPNSVDDDNDDARFNPENLIRLITRVVFVWFLKEKGLVNRDLFDAEKLKFILSDFEPEATLPDPTARDAAKRCNFYTAIMQNLFFATLNQEIDKRGFVEEVKFLDHQKHGIKGFYRNLKLFALNDAKKVLELFAVTPFVNGGLFECLDNVEQNGKIYSWDGFSNTVRDKYGHLKRSLIANELFFGCEKDCDLSRETGNPKAKKVKVRGLIRILESYNFTIEENTPNDVVVALDPELLGKVFENLLGAYNPETREVVRKSTGSFYTPREIVDYMVDESLKSYLKTKCSGLEDAIDQLFANADALTVGAKLGEKEKSAIIDALRSVKILDPSCGSGAFPMGCLLRLTSLISALVETEDVYQTKLSIIRNSLFGSDLQPIAVQISRLRFFISLLCEQTPDASKPNRGIEPLPNLENNFVAANTLMSVDVKGDVRKILRNEPDIVALIEQLRETRENLFMPQAASKKAKLKKNDEDLRQAINFAVAGVIDRELANEINPLEAEIKSIQKRLDSLTDADRESKVTVSRFVNLFGEEEVKEVVSQSVEKTLKNNVRRLQELIRDKRNDGQRRHLLAELCRLVNWNPFAFNVNADFFDSEWMFNVKDGFDIVIGNPPYVQLQNDGGRLAKLYDGCGYSTFAKTGDIYCLFYERGAQLLKDGGHLCYITSNKWMRAGYGETLRAYLAEQTNPELLIDFSGEKIFESATVDTNILLFCKGAKNAGKTYAVVGKPECRKDLGGFVQQHGSECKFTSSESWVILTPIEQSIKRKIEAVGTPLKDWDIQINYGIKTGFNPAFIIDEKTRSEILTNCKDEDERNRTDALIRPILRGRDIKRYSYEWPGLYIIATFPAKHLDIEDYPAVKTHLLSFGKERLEQTGKEYVVNGEKIKARKKTTNKWFETQDTIAYMDDFLKQKILWKRVGSLIRFSYDENGFFGLDSTCMAVGKNIPFLCCILNSKIGNYLLKDSPQTGTGDLLISVQAVEPLLIPKPSIQDEKFCEQLLEKVISGDLETVKMLDEFMFKLYKLSTAESKYISDYVSNFRS